MQESKHTSFKGTKDEEVQVPIDTKQTCYWIFFLYGIGVLFPFSVILACMDFYIIKMPGYLP